MNLNDCHNFDEDCNFPNETTYNPCKNPISTTCQKHQHSLWNIDSLGCQSSTSITALVYQNPEVNIEPIDPVCFGNISILNSTSNSPNIQNWSWNFGNNDIGNTEDTTYLYLAEGSFEVTLEIYDNNDFSLSHNFSV